MAVALLSIETLLEDFANGKRKFLVVDSRPEPEFLEGHIPRAIRIAWEDWCETAPVEAAPILHEPGYWGTLADTGNNVFEQRLISCGIKQHEPIVVYADSIRSKGREGRVAWMLLYLGASQVFILDHGWNEWVRKGGPVETGDQFERSANQQRSANQSERSDNEERSGNQYERSGNDERSGQQSERTPGEFTIALDARRRIKHDDLFQNPDYEKQLPLMIDTRTAAEFHGDCHDYQPFKGKLPNSILFPFANLFESDGTFVSRERYLEITPADILRSSSRVAYCEVGVRAATFSLLHEIYAGEIIPVYDGSIIEWGWLRQTKSPTT
ncbi:MAG: rhodanese-like domain-containing protein [Candidatus Melainabacteria bacterium]|nr:rhodanese-like domain-containing protein [Candidatus Melainabacteria bacterium]